MPASNTRVGIYDWCFVSRAPTRKWALGDKDHLQLTISDHVCSPQRKSDKHLSSGCLEVNALVLQVLLLSLLHNRLSFNHKNAQLSWKLEGPCLPTPQTLQLTVSALKCVLCHVIPVILACLGPLPRSPCLQSTLSYSQWIVPMVKMTHPLTIPIQQRGKQVTKSHPRSKSNEWGRQTWN